MCFKTLEAITGQGKKAFWSLLPGNRQPTLHASWAIFQPPSIANSWRGSKAHLPPYSPAPADSIFGHPSYKFGVLPNMDPQILGPVCTPPSLRNCTGLQSSGPQALRPGGLCLRNSPSLGLPPPARPKVPPGSATSPAFPHSPAFRTAESNVVTPLHSPGTPSSPSAPCNLTPSPLPTKPTPSAKPTRCTSANIDWDCSSPGPPPAGKTSRDPSEEASRPAEWGSREWGTRGACPRPL